MAANFHKTHGAFADIHFKFYVNMNHFQRIGSMDSAAIEWLRFPLVVCVVIIHSFGPPVDFTHIDWSALSCNDAYNVVRVFFSRVITHSAVPCFYMISGYLFFFNVNHFDCVVWKNKIKSRVRTLLVPYLLWNLIFIVVIIGKDLLRCAMGIESVSTISAWYHENGGILRMFWNCNVWGENVVGWLGNQQRDSAPIDLPLWFLRDLMVATFFTPIIHWLIKHFGVWYLTFLGLAFVSKAWPAIDGFSIAAVFFFSLGAYMGVRKLSFTQFTKFDTVIYLVTLALAIVDVFFGGPDTFYGNIVHPFFRISGALAIFCIGLKFCKRAWNPPLVRSVFFIYAFHGLYIIGYYLGVVPQQLTAESNVFIKLLVYFLIPILKLLACLGVFVLMERFTPRLLAILTGNRN